MFERLIFYIGSKDFVLATQIYNNFPATVVLVSTYIDDSEIHIVILLLGNYYFLSPSSTPRPRLKDIFVKYKLLINSDFKRNPRSQYLANSCHHEIRLLLSKHFLQTKFKINKTINLDVN